MSPVAAWLPVRQSLRMAWVAHVPERRERCRCRRGSFEGVFDTRARRRRRERQLRASDEQIAVHRNLSGAERDARRVHLDWRAWIGDVHDTEARVTVAGSALSLPDEEIPAFVAFRDAELERARPVELHVAHGLQVARLPA